jgi:hypothetical protein
VPEIKKAVIKSYDPDAHKATVQIAGSLGVWLDGIRVATDIPAADVVAGRQCTVLFLDPSNQDDAVVITIQGALPSGGGGGSTTFTALTDTPVSYTGQAGKHVRVNSGATGLEFFDLFGIPNAWGALQTFNAGLQLAAGQQIEDSGGTGRILLATSLPQLTLTGSTRIDSNAAIDCAPSTSPDIKLNISPTPSGATDWRAIAIIPSIVFAAGNTHNATGVYGSANARGSAGSSGHNLSGLDFAANALSTSGAIAFATVTGARAAPGAAALGGTASVTITDLDAFQPYFGNISSLLGTITITNLRALHSPALTLNDALISIGTANVLHIEDVAGSSLGTVRLLEIGPSTPYLRLLGGGDPPASQSNLLLKLGTILKQISEGATDSGGTGYRALRVPN